MGHGDLLTATDAAVVVPMLSVMMADGRSCMLCSVRYVIVQMRLRVFQDGDATAYRHACDGEVDLMTASDGPQSTRAS